MAQTQANNTDTNNTAASNGAGKQREAKPLTAVEAITKISKILDQLSLADRKRVLAFVSEGVNGSAE
jgi:hypothetical protein